MKSKKLEKLMLTVTHSGVGCTVLRVNVGPLVGDMNFVATASPVRLAGPWSPWPWRIRRNTWLHVRFRPPYSAWFPPLVSDYEPGAPWFEGRWVRPSTFETNSLLLGLHPDTAAQDYAMVLKGAMVDLFRTYLSVQKEVEAVWSMVVDTFGGPRSFRGSP